MSHNYSWMKAGVRVIALNDDRGEADENHGDIFTLSCEPFQLDPFMSMMNLADPTEWYVHAGGEKAHIRCRYLRPYKDDDDSKDTTSWEEIANIIGVDIRRLEETA